MSDASLTAAKAKKIFTISIVVSLVIGAGWGYLQYGSLLDARSWNVMGLVIILVLGGVAGVLALSAAARARKSRAE